ncbi:exosome complex component RRP45 [Anthonomus grandis grandis]|uniref:exosome complex component RRP45 n=1 Tax=Anthonomus grandis grandis TaxID=2921223 RepID=UPI0021651453|nr:exosome complex component RRP45 [Anthonomus grandis grandis]
MSNIRKTTITNCEKQFLLKNLTEWRRLDGRAFDEFRNLQIEFGKDWGCCYVSLGKTRVIAQVSCELQVPKSSRPSEGILNINLELNPIGEPNFEAGRQSEMLAQLSRLLEKCIKDSKAVDLESLCVKMNERVWSFRVDINLLNHEGNIVDCASIAALAALAHFRRPDVTCDGTDFKIHSIKERDPIPTVLHHYPVCISYAIFNGGDFIIADPTLLEEGVAEAFLTVSVNAYRELCGLHLGGKVQITPDVIFETTNKAARRACEVIELIKTSVETDTNTKIEARTRGLTLRGKTFDISDVDVPLSELSVCLDHWKLSKGKKRKKSEKKQSPIDGIEKMETEDQPTVTKEENDIKDTINVVNEHTAELIPNKNNAEWAIIVSDEEEDGIGDEVICVEPVKETVEINDSGSEEETVVVLNTGKKKKSPAKKSPKTKKVNS